MDDVARLKALSSIVSVKTIIKYDELMTSLAFDNEDALESFIISAIFHGHIGVRSFFSFFSCLIFTPL